MPEPTVASQVFICHAKEDHAFACQLCETLRQNGVAAWMGRPPEAFALEGILPGQDSALQIERRLSECDAIIVVLSPASVAQQGFVQPEFRLGLHGAGRRRGLPVVAVLQNGCDVPAFSAGGIALNALDWIDHTAQGDAAILAAVKQLRARAQPAAREAKKSGAIRRPRIAWRSALGRVHWRNTIDVENGRLYLTSCGARWNQDDRGDGIYCLDAETGALHWHCNTAGDPNEALVHGDVIVAGTDAGQLAVVEKATGALTKEHRVWHPIFARPFALHSDKGERIFAISHKGAVLMVDASAGTITEVASLPFLLRANPIVTADGRAAILFGETGQIARAFSEGSRFQVEPLATKTYFHTATHSGRRNAGLVASPVLDGSSVIGGATRDTYYDAPSLFRFDIAQKKFIWGEREEEPRGKDNPFGNLRSQPLLMGQEVIFAPAYAAALYAADKETGEIRWKIPVGQELLQQWSSPAQVDEQRVLLARADGILYQIDIAARKIEWAISLLVTPSEMAAANRTGKLGPGPSEAAHNGITATPAFHDGRIYIGTTEGELFSIEDAG